LQNQIEAVIGVWQIASGKFGVAVLASANRQSSNSTPFSSVGFAPIHDSSRSTPPDPQPTSRIRLSDSDSNPSRRNSDSNSRCRCWIK
jgi:hypothetical protein